MKRIILILIAIFYFNLSYGQNFKELVNYEFKTLEDYKTETDKVLSCANYLFTNPANSSELNRQVAIQYIMKWMEGTPDYTFEIGQKAMDLTKGNNDLFGLYFAAMTKTVLEEDNTKLTNEEIYDRSEKILVDYCSDPKNKMKPSKKIKKIIKAKS